MYVLLKKLSLLFFFINIVICGFAQSASQPAEPTGEISYTLFLVGDTGEPQAGINQSLKALQSQLNKASQASQLILLGNPFYPKVLPKKDDLERTNGENKLKPQLDLIKNFAGKTILIPGDYGKKNKDERLHRRQENFIADYLENDKLVQPDHSCPGPVEMHINDDILLLILDTKYLLPNNQPPAEGSGCEITRPSQVLAQIDDILRAYPEKHVVLATHISPDMNGLEYRYLQRSLAMYLASHPGLVMVQSNGAALSHSFADSLHYVSAGTMASRAKFAANVKTLFTNPASGFAKINFYSSGEAWLEFWTATNSNDAPAYRALLMKKPTQAMLVASLANQHFDFSDSVVTTSASLDYQAGKFRRWLLGDNYRDEWSEKITVPVFDIGKMHGGLKVVQMGGGFQTRSLRLADANGKEYVLRSVEKYPAAALPRPLRETVAADVVKDQISASHPYGPLVIPTLSAAANVYHTNPKYFYIPDDPRFGKYRVGFANTLGLFEERADDDQSDAPNFGNSKKVVSTSKVIENKEEDNDNEIDQKAVLRARLFDFLIGDWDRHEDQWRWASFEKKGTKGKIYRPIPRDRDMVFFVNEGVIPNIGSRKWLLPKVQGYDHDYRDIAGFNFNPRYFDRLFLTSLTLEDWVATANEIKNAISDSAIEAAVKQLPEPIFKMSGAEIISKLKAHRNSLPKDAADYYKFLAKEVNVVGSDKNELFEVQRGEGLTKVTVRKIAKSGHLEQVLFERTFNINETEEIRLYGLDGKDEFKITGKASKGIRVRVIGGDDADKIVDDSNVKGIGKKTAVYDTKSGNDLQLGKEAKDFTSSDPKVNEYDPKYFKYNYKGPLLAVGYNRDDGILVGAGTLIRTQGFQKEPFAISHRVLTRYALLTNSFRVDYQGYFTKVLFRKIDMQLNADIRTPNYAENFFGLGNETTFNKDVPFNFYRYRSKQYYFSALFGTKLGKHHTLLLGPTYQSIDLNTGNDNYAAVFGIINNEGSDFYQRKNFGGFDFRYTFDARDNAAIPTAGNLLRVGAGVYVGLNEDAANYQNIFGEWSFYKTFRIPLKLTFANRVGAAHNFGDYEFYQANTLDGNYNLRGYRRNRFAGGTSFYNNTDLRLRLFSFKTYLFPGSLGIIGFHDIGRVWEEGEKSKTWHTGYGGGIWISPVNMFVLSAEYAISKETKMPLLRATFLF
ncbi:BamA/TamA family outer membrane protein [Adhaeribacter aquaticus]|uniref:BamA/TamA family outer membrane protein n=1 Tax=Adhaeribacter aquaticus TaxID=299567 RepID=UPI00042A8CBF|nr:BamA/TamA family outer membrane protein [Adhaeribacter aquaticus]